MGAKYEINVKVIQNGVVRLVDTSFPPMETKEEAIEVAKVLLNDLNNVRAIIEINEGRKIIAQMWTRLMREDMN